MAQQETCVGKVCPRLSAPGSLVKCITHECAHFQHILGRQPQTGEVMDHWDCAFNLTNILIIENAQETRQTAKAVESARNEARKDAHAVSSALIAVAEGVQAHPGRLVSEPSRRVGWFRRLVAKEIS